MRWINYHHLLYFWTVATEGSVTAAAKRLNLTQPGVSTQIRLLEESLGHPLFRKRGRGLVLTNTGRIVFDYADEIFSLGREMLDVLGGERNPDAPRFRVGVADVLPKLVAYRLLDAVFRMEPRPIIEAREETVEKLVAAMALHEIDLVLSDAPIRPDLRIRGFSHLIGESGVSLFASRELARKLKRRLPASLDGAPFLLPSHGTALRADLDRWLERHDIQPRIAGEFDDSALLKVFGQAGEGVFAAPSAIAEEIARQYRVAPLIALDGVRERYYAISLERRIRHPAVVAITESARGVFGD